MKFRIKNILLLKATEIFLKMNILTEIILSKYLYSIFVSIVALLTESKIVRIQNKKWNGIDSCV